MIGFDICEASLKRWSKELDPFCNAPMFPAQILKRPNSSVIAETGMLSWTSGEALEIEEAKELKDCTQFHAWEAMVSHLVDIMLDITAFHP